jgi:hypothetical protein
MVARRPANEGGDRERRNLAATDHRDLRAGLEKTVLELPPHVGFDRALDDAIDQAGKQWRTEGDAEESIEVTVELEARLDFWNPGGIGQYKAKITPGGSS